MEVAVYSGSFNPLHIGHLAILDSLVPLFDKVLLVVSPQNPLKEIDGSTASARYDNACRALKRHPELLDKVIVSDFELRMDGPSYTYRTLDALQSESPEDHFTLIIGGDQLADFRRWREYSHILEQYGVAVFPRKGFDNSDNMKSLLKENPLYKIRLIDMPLMNISSTYLRQALERGEDVGEWLM